MNKEHKTPCICKTCLSARDKELSRLTEIFDNKMDSLLKEQRESPMGVSQWRKHGKKHGYWEYFNKQQREEDISELGYEIEAIFSKHKIPCICPKGGIIDEEKMLVCNECEGSEWTLPQSLKEINYKISNLIKSLKE